MADPLSSTKLCRYCGREISSETPFCWYCGRELETRPERPIESSNGTPLWVYAVIAAIVLVALGVLLAAGAF